MSTPADTLIVLIGDEVAGTLTRARNQTLSFTYDDAYRAQTDPTPLSLSIPVQVRTHSDRVIRPWCDNLLPDNNAVLERWAKRFQVSATSPFGLLSSPVGLDCAGAVRFVAPERLDAALASPARTTFLDEAAVAARLVELRNDTTAWLGTDFTGRFSLGGAQAKTALSYHGRRWGLPSGSAATTHILKPAILGLDDHDLNEHLCLRAAALAGLIAVRTQVMAFATEQAIVIERYDRTYRRRRLVRVHQEDACGALGVAPASKYQSDGGPGAADIAGLLRRSMPSTVADDAIWRFADAVVWNWLIGGTDAHAKNYSLLLAGSQVRLAPLYDIASALPYWPEQKLRLAMKLGGDYKLTVQRTTTWKRLAADLGVDAHTLVLRARALAERTPEAFVAAAAEVEHLPSTLPALLCDKVTQRVTRCLTTL